MLDLSVEDPLKQKRFRDVKILAVTLEHQVVQFLVVNKQGKVRLKCRSADQSLLLARVI